MSNTPIVDNMNNTEPEPEKTWREDLRDFLRTSRKAVTAGLGAFASSIGVAIPLIFGDGVVTAVELVPALVIALGAGLAFGIATYQVPNDAR